MKTVIVGGVAGGASAAARLRRLDEQAEIIMLERGDYISFANCGLPFYIGGTIKKKSALTLQTPQSFKNRFCVDVRTGHEVIKVSGDNVQVKNLQTGEIYTENFDNLILSTGAKPILPSIQGVDSKGVFTIRNIPDTLAIKEYITEKKPKSAVVVGGGYIGLEMTENLCKAGLEVTIVDLSDHLIAPLDEEISVDIYKYLESLKVKVILNNAVHLIEEKHSKLTLALTEGNVYADMVILAIGVRPETELAHKAGIELDERGCILVNNKMQTSIKNIYAVGDCIEVKDYVTKKKAFIPLAGPANKQGRIAADNICGIESEYKGTLGSSVVKIFDMTVAMTGVNERTAKLCGLNYDKVYTQSPSHATYYPNATNMLIKTVFEKDTGKILGMQIVGFDGVDKRVDIVATAIKAGMTAFDLLELELCYAPPFSSAKDPINMVGYVIENVITKKVKNFHWHDVDGLPRDSSVTLLDVRRENEVIWGKIDGFMNIPLDELRNNLHLIPKDKPVYVHCQSGMRSYIACRILTGHGYDSYNLSGGYRIYSLKK